jgi:hypothetical protein
VSETNSKVAVISLRGLCQAASNGAKAEKAVSYLYDTVRRLRYECSIRPEWLIEIKHDGFRVIARKEGKRVRCIAGRAMI